MSIIKKGLRKCYRVVKEKQEIKRLRTLHIISNDERQRQKSEEFVSPIVFSIITPLYNTPEKYLTELIQSLKNQTYVKWELCLADGSDASHAYVEKICKMEAEKDSRIRYQKLSENKGISENTNVCIMQATGDYYGLLDHDDILHESALYEVMKVIDETEADFIYTDEAKFSDKIENAASFNFKPGFGKDELRSHNYICHFTVFKKSLLVRTGDVYRPEFDGSQDHDMVLRLTEKAEKIVHIPKILYYWRVHPESVSMNLDSKEYAVDAAIRAVDDQLRRTGEFGKVASNLPYRTIYRVKYSFPENAKVSIIVDTQVVGDEWLELKGKLKEYTNYQNIEILRREELEDVTGEFYLFLNGNCFPKTKEWICEMLMYAARADICAVGGKVIFEDDTIFHAGIVLDNSRTEKVYFLCQGTPNSEQGYEAMLRHVRNTTAVWGGCMMVRRDVWQDLGGFSGAKGYEDIDFCLKGKKEGLLSVFTPFVEMVYTEEKSDLYQDADSREFEEKWGKELKSDVYYHPNWKLLDLV